MTGWKKSIFKMTEYGQHLLICYFLNMPHLFKPADIQCKVPVLNEHKLVILHVGRNDLARPSTKALPDVARRRMAGLVAACREIYQDIAIAISAVCPRIDV